MAKKKQEKTGGAPDWMVTYGDMMSLLLCFFIMLVAMSQIKQDEKFQEVMESIQKAFGYIGSIGPVPTTNPPKLSLLKRLESIVIPKRIKHMGDSDDQGVEGRNFRVTQVREGVKINVGGPVAFDRFRADLKPQGEAVVKELAAKIRGHNTKIEVRGHATFETLPPDSPYRDPIDLSYARARAVADALIRYGVRPSRIRISAAGATEPLVRQAYNEERLAANRRVEIIVSEALISDYEGEPVAVEEPISHGRGS